jgi:hypothetical protein
MKDRSDLLQELMGKNIVALTAGLFAKGHYIHPVRSKVVNVRREQKIDHPWVHVRPQETDAGCSLHRKMFFALADTNRAFVPTYCMECWKVVVKPRTVEQLFDLYDLMEELGLPSKCGFEDREWVCGNYGGYFYTRSKQEGLSRKHQVKPLIEKAVGAVPVYLKRFCTEFENKLCPGKTSTYEQPKWAKELEEEFYNAYELPKESRNQPEFLKRHIKFRWVVKAWAVGDKTAEKLNGGKPVYPPTETYN